MRVIYLTIAETSVGVRKKLTDKTNSLRKAGLDVHFCVIGAEEEIALEYVSQIKVDKALSKKIGKWFFFWRLSVVVEQWALYRAALKFVNTNSANVILFRYPVSDLFLWWFMLRCKQQVIFEYNSIEIFELNLKRREFFYFQYFYWSERIFGRPVRKLSAGIIGVTPEITNYQVKLLDKRIPSTTISNGIDVARVKGRNGTTFNNTQLNLLLLAGSQAQWHGIDILLRSLSSILPDCKVTCFVAGSVSSEQLELSRNIENCTLLPSQMGEDLDRLVDQCHIGIGSLGFESDFLTQASPLKVREYWARGLPFVIGYEDADLIQNKAMMPFYLRSQVKDGHIDLSQIVEFAKRVYSIPNVTAQLRALAFQYIDYEVKAKQYIEFLNSMEK